MLAYLRRAGYVFATFMFYVFVAFQWMWLLAPLIYVLYINRHLFKQFISSTPVPVHQPASIDPFWVSVIAVIMVFLTFVMIAYVVIRAPQAVAKTGDALAHSTAHTIQRKLTHKKTSKKRRLSELLRITWGVKLTFALIPLLALVIPFSYQELTPHVSRALILMLWVVSMCSLAASYVTRNKDA